ncbi:hypothetical protein FACS189485_20920 [Spirochaetia bacterium]|nr:hypothetical protein FACS189485_20920 [Spirochaetia bacterium]
MVKKNGLTKCETKFIGDMVRKYLKEFNSDEEFKEDFFQMVHDDVIQFCADGKTMLSFDDLERTVIFHIGLSKGSTDGYGDGFHQGLITALRERA